MFTLSLLFAAVLPFVSAQSDSPAFRIEGVEAHFTQAGIVPSLLPTFNPSALLTINYDGVGDLTPGQSVSQEQVGPTPTVKIEAANSSISLSDKYTLVMADADVAGTTNENSVTRHWLVNGVTISNGQVSNSSATAITQYAGPAPAEGSGPHRYVIILYQQPDSFSAPSGLSEPNIGVDKFDLNAYVKDSGLGNIIAANYLTVEVGQSTVSVSATSAVESSTLSPIATSSNSGTASSDSANPTQTSNNENGASIFGVTTSFVGLSLVLGLLMA
ncbi:PEBP-like protein [Dendrothele bispora CBS 962.96]|uniref:PEBP-like protein n=1 Tax=Dendrothele bispora (strain CBS 962.96) TaxID=1314807 RepID=A0A4S8MGS3_DENBC|nr:PEBP-like protein [Dendrothele bispora CBS 962.96]THV01721.1 PEBP-like protein [Dendrothele bispora CBS 962.96]